MKRKRTWVDFLRIIYQIKEPIPIRKYVSFLEEAIKGRTTFQHIHYFLRLKDKNPQLYARIRTAFEKSNPILFKQFKVIERYHQKNPSALLMGMFDVHVVAYKDYLNDPIVSLSEKREILSILQTKSPLVYCDLMQELQQKQPQLLQRLKENPLPIKDKNKDKELFAARMAYLEQERQFSQKKQLLSDVEVKDGVVVLSYMMDRLSRQNPVLYKQIKQEFLNNKELQTPLNEVFDKTKTDKEKQTVVTALRNKNPLVYQQVALLLVNADVHLAQKFGLSDSGIRLEDIAYLKDRRMLHLYFAQSDKNLEQKKVVLKSLEQTNPKLHQMIVQDMMQKTPQIAKELNIYTPKYIYSPVLKTTIDASVKKLTQEGRQAMTLIEKRKFLINIAKKDPVFYNHFTGYLTRTKPAFLKEVMQDKTADNAGKLNMADGVEIAIQSASKALPHHDANTQLHRIALVVSDSKDTPVLTKTSQRG